ncbi:sensor histidine kinase [Aquimarina macrocephali]|uniref:sensor histidine kinase n=1 Tax=Aquimarina macrocephali TaxID=666563 RepID=UPI003F662180
MKQTFEHDMYSIYVLFCIVFGVLAIMNDLGNTGRLLLLTSIYFGFTILFLKVKALQKKNPWLKYNKTIVLILLTVVCISGSTESYPKRMLLLLFFAESLMFLYVHVYFDFRYRNGSYIIKKWGLPRFFFRMFFIAVTVFLIVSVLYQYQPFGEILDPYYFIFLFVFLIEVLISHLYSTIRLKNEQTQAELLHLRSQLNPHFFFNTLNNLYALTLKNSKQAPEVILKLSEMMRYTIYEGEKSMVSISDEIAYLENYMELHKIRYKKPITLEFNHLIDESLMIPPLLFINLLENAFKHGIEVVSENAYIKMSLTNDDNFIYFLIENNFEENIEIKHKGIGITNLKRRLSLLYPKAHKLEFIKQGNVFKTKLKISI